MAENLAITLNTNFDGNGNFAYVYTWEQYAQKFSVTAAWTSNILAPVEYGRFIIDVNGAVQEIAASTPAGKLINWFLAETLEPEVPDGEAFDD